MKTRWSKKFAILAIIGIIVLILSFCVVNIPVLPEVIPFMMFLGGCDAIMIGIVGWLIAIAVEEKQDENDLNF